METLRFGSKIRVDVDTESGTISVYEDSVLIFAQNISKHEDVKAAAKAAAKIIATSSAMADEDIQDSVKRSWVQSSKSWYLVDSSGNLVKC